MTESEPLIGKKNFAVCHPRETRRGAGWVWSIRQKIPSWGRFVALKFLPDDLNRDSQALERFRREARAASFAEITRISARFTKSESTKAIVLSPWEFLDGATLKHLIAGRPMDLEQVLAGWRLRLPTDWMRRMRRVSCIEDIKPANIFVTKRGSHAKILDFGLAKVTAGGARKRRKHHRRIPEPRALWIRWRSIPII